MKELFRRALEAFSAGDAMGMPTEFMTRERIKKEFGIVDDLIDPQISPVHPNLEKGRVTDDTEQVLYLVKTYYSRSSVTVEATVEGLLKWIEETEADKKGYIGPSSLKALKRISRGEDPRKAGVGGTTCGAAMRVFAPALSVKHHDFEALKNAIWSATVPTHNTNIAMEAAMALGFGYHFAALGTDFKGIINAILKGAMIGRGMADKEYVGASTGKRIEYLLYEIERIRSEEELLDFIYDVVGTTMESNEVVPAAVAIFAYAKENTWLAIRLGASVGGDTDTIAAIAGALSCLHAGRHNIPIRILKTIIQINALNLEKYASMLYEMFH